jgi:uncharacterized RmlC-like cupin family protein
MSSPIRIVSPAEFDPGTAQTPGSERLAALTPDLGVETALWAGVFKVEPGAYTGICHHGAQETVAYVLAGVCEVRWGANGEFRSSSRYLDVITGTSVFLKTRIQLSKGRPVTLGPER